MGVLDAIEPHKALVYPDLSYQYDDPVSGFRVMKNLGRAATAPATLICGDGVTANTFPTQVTPRGVRKVSAPAVQYVDCGNIGDWSGNYSLLALVDFLSLIDTTIIIGRNTYPAQNQWHMAVGLSGATGAVISYYSNGGGGIFGTRVFERRAKAIAIGATVTSGNVLALTVNGEPSGGGAASSASRASNLWIGNNWYNGETQVLGAAVFPYYLTPAQMIELEYRMRREAHVA